MFLRHHDHGEEEQAARGETAGQRFGTGTGGRLMGLEHDKNVRAALGAFRASLKRGNLQKAMADPADDLIAALRAYAKGVTGGGDPDAAEALVLKLMASIIAGLRAG